MKIRGSRTRVGGNLTETQKRIISGSRTLRKENWQDQNMRPKPGTNKQKYKAPYHNQEDKERREVTKTAAREGPKRVGGGVQIAK